MEETEQLDDLTFEDLDFEPISKGRAPTVLDIEILGPITAQDLANRNQVSIQSGLTSGAPNLDKIRGIHHQIARYLADGLTPTEVSCLTGFSLSRISTLQKDPAFKELMSHYGDKKSEAYVDVHRQLASLGSDAIAELHDRLLEDPSALSSATLIDITKAMLDRAGFGPVQKSQSTVITGSFSEVQKVKELAAKGGNNEQATILGELSSGSTAERS